MEPVTFSQMSINLIKTQFNSFLSAALHFLPRLTSCCTSDFLAFSATKNTNSARNTHATTFLCIELEFVSTPRIRTRMRRAANSIESARQNAPYVTMSSDALGSGMYCQNEKVKGNCSSTLLASSDEYTQQLTGIIK